MLPNTALHMQKQIQIGKIYRHFKGNYYIVLDIATHSETKEEYVVYRALYGNYTTYIKPYDMFASEVDHEKYPDVKQEYRFELCEDEEAVKTVAFVDEVIGQIKLLEDALKRYGKGISFCSYF